MNINSDINVLGSLPDWNLIYIISQIRTSSSPNCQLNQSVTRIKTDKSIRRFESAINNTLIRTSNNYQSELISSFLSAERISNDSLYLLFWNASYNNELLGYLNENVLFPAFYSGRLTIMREEVIACIDDLATSEKYIQSWSDSTRKILASKYLTLLKKFNLMEGTLNKTFLSPYLSDKLFIVFVYWVKAIETTPNLLKSRWLKYSFFDYSYFLERIQLKKYAEYFHVTVNGDNLNVVTSILYSELYHALK